LRFGLGFQALPGKNASEKVYKDIPEGLHVITSTLLNAKMSVDAGVAGSAGQVLVFPVRNVLVCSRITKFFGQAKVYGIDKVAFFAKAHQKVIWLDVSM
jgi:hypothetical protein